MNIKSMVVVPFAFVLSVLLALVLMTALQAPANAHSDNKDHKQTTKKDSKKSEATYTYIAQPGDSYSEMARKAIQTYGIKHKVNLSQSRIVYAETNLTQTAGSPALLQGQKVEIQESAVKNWVDKAKALGNDQATKWDKYAVGVNFNTDNVGEVRT